jgi:hypothetical protein
MSPAIRLKILSNVVNITNTKTIFHFNMKSITHQTGEPVKEVVVNSARIQYHGVVNTID